MDRMTLSEAQESVIIDFIKRWGVDSPELVAELLDHYCELALEEMEKGRAFQEIVNSWKTKSTLRELRKIQKEYKKGLTQLWKKESKKAFIWVFTGRPMIILVPLYCLFWYLALKGETLFYLNMAIGLKALVSFVLILVFIQLNKRRKRLDGFNRIASLGTGNAILAYQFLNHMNAPKFQSEFIEPKWAAIAAVVYLATFIIDFAAFRLFKIKEEETRHLTEEVLAEFKLPPRV